MLNQLLLYWICLFGLLIVLLRAFHKAEAKNNLREQWAITAFVLLITAAHWIWPAILV